MMKKFIAIAAASASIAAQVASPVAAQTSQGTIQGSLGYPSEYLPSLIVCAQKINSRFIQCIQTKAEQKQYSITVPPGDYYVFANYLTVDETDKGFYTKYVTCGLKGGCNDHSLIPVRVSAGQVVKNIDPKDFYTKRSR